MEKTTSALMLTPRKVMEMTGFERSRVYTLFGLKDFPTIKIGGRLYVRREAFLDWLKAQERNA